MTEGAGQDPRKGVVPDPLREADVRGEVTNACKLYTVNSVVSLEKCSVIVRLVYDRHTFYPVSYHKIQRIKIKRYVLIHISIHTMISGLQMVLFPWH